MTFRFGWIGPTRRASLHKKIGHCVQAWLADWQIGHDGAEPRVEDAPIIPYSPDEACVLQAGAGQPNLMVVAARDELTRLGNWLAGIRESAAMLSHEIGRAAIDDLAGRIARLAGRGDVLEHEESTWPQTLTREELGAVGLTFDAGGATINLALSRDAVDVVCPPSPTLAALPLQQSDEAAGGVNVQLTATLDFGAISMRELAELRVGEVLVGECLLDEPVRMLAPGGAQLGSARMGRIGNRLAVAINQYPLQQETP